MRGIRLVWLVWLGLQLLGCRSGETKGHAEKALPAPTIAPAAPLAKTQPVPPASRIAESDVRELVARWHEMQNAGDLAGYEALYAQRFQGIKRVGTSTYRFDRKHWMLDRQRMFAAPMQVAISGLEITITDRTAIARFEQSWSSKRFRDRGPKQLIVVREGAALRISNEQMLGSEVEVEQPISQELALAQFMQVVHPRNHYVVLSADASEGWARGDAELDGDQDESSARKAAIADAIPQPARDMLGTSIVAYDSKGIACRAKVGTPYLWRRFAGQNDYDPGDAAAPLSEAQRADVTWRAASRRTLLVAELTEADGDCSTALWAHEADRPEPAIFVREDASSELARRIELQVRALPEYREADRKYRAAVVTDYGGEYGPENGVTRRWEYFDGAKPTMSSWRRGERQFASYEVSTGGCAFGDSTWALFEVRGDRLALVGHPGRSNLPSDFGFLSIVDIDLDGFPDALGGDWNNAFGEADTVARGTSQGLRFVSEINPPFFGCGC